MAIASTTAAAPVAADNWRLRSWIALQTYSELVLLHALQGTNRLQDPWERALIEYAI